MQLPLSRCGDYW